MLAIWGMLSLPMFKIHTLVFVHLVFLNIWLTKWTNRQYRENLATVGPLSVPVRLFFFIFISIQSFKKNLNVFIGMFSGREVEVIAM